MIPARVPGRRNATAGVTLIEVLVALVLFALIGGAGFTVLDQVIRVQSRTEARLEQLAQMQRAMQILTQDFMQASRGSLVRAEGVVSFRRSAGIDEMAVRYTVENRTLVRSVSGSGTRGQTRQMLLPNVESAAWQFFDPASGWIPTWPPRAQGSVRINPPAVALDVILEGPDPSGSLRRIALLPQDPSQ